jgi:hypothetical protein
MTSLQQSIHKKDNWIRCQHRLVLLNCAHFLLLTSTLFLQTSLTNNQTVYFRWPTPFEVCGLRWDPHKFYKWDYEMYIRVIGINTSFFE